MSIVERSGTGLEHFHRRIYKAPRGLLGHMKFHGTVAEGRQSGKAQLGDLTHKQNSDVIFIQLFMNLFQKFIKLEVIFFT